MTLPAPDPDYAGQVELLTKRQAEICRLVGRGMDQKAIGTNLGVSYKTVNNTMAEIHQRLGTASMAQVAIWATRTGLVENPQWIERLPARGTPRGVRGAMVAVASLSLALPSPAQTTTLHGLSLPSPTLVCVETADTPAHGSRGVRFTGDHVALTRTVDPGWDGRGVVIYNALFAPRDPNDPPARFLIGAPRGTVLVLSWTDLSGERARSWGLMLDPRDTNLDGEATVLDINAALNLYAAGCWDFNTNGLCNAADLIAYVGCWGTP